MTFHENHGGRYGDYILPDLWASECDEYVHLSIWSEYRRQYLKEHHKVIYYNNLTSGTLSILIIRLVYFIIYYTK